MPSICEFDLYIKQKRKGTKAIIDKSNYTERQLNRIEGCTKHYTVA